MMLPTRFTPGLVLVAIAGLLNSCGERPEQHYATLSDVGDAMALGWMPRWITTDASDIRELHDIDTNATWGQFTFGEVGARELAVSCKETDEAGFRFPPERAAAWWPTQLTGRGSPQAGYRVMTCQERSLDKPGRWKTSGAYVAVNDGTRTAYFWRLPG